MRLDPEFGEERAGDEDEGHVDQCLFAVQWLQAEELRPLRLNTPKQASSQRQKA